MYFHFQTLRKYTASLLNTFNKIEVQTIQTDGKLFSKYVPIQFSNKEKSEIMNQLNENQIFSGNSQVLPRMILTFDGLEFAPDRGNNKFLKINTEFKGHKYSFQFDSVPYNFNYTVIAQARGMNEASIIIEQVLAYFNPTYCLRIRELPIDGLDPTSIILDLNSTDIEQQSFDDYSTNIVTIRFSLTLRGNIYPAIKDQEVIKQIQMFIYGEDLIDMDIKDNVVTSNKKIKAQKDDVITYDKDGLNHNKKFDTKPIIKDIIFKDDYLKCIYEDRDTHLENCEFFWEINGKKAKSNKQSFKININLNQFNVKCYMIDEDGNQSETFEKTIKKY